MYLQASDWGTQLYEDNRWRTSEISSFAANLGFVFFQCQEGEASAIIITLHLILSSRRF